MSAVLKTQTHYYTPEEYLTLERATPTKSEYVDGDIVAMAGASLEHNFIVGNLLRAIGNRVNGKGFAVLPSDMRLHVPQSNSFFYPDVSVICGTPQLVAGMQDTLINPTVLIEVLSPSTESYDRGEKFERYRKIETLREYVLISQDKPMVEVFTHQKGAMWLYVAYAGIEAQMVLSSLDVTLPLSEVYLNVEFATTDAPETDAER